MRVQPRIGVKSENERLLPGLGLNVVMSYGSGLSNVAARPFLV